MRLTIVGCSGSYAGPDSAASCYLVEAEWAGRTWRLLVDLGSGALGTLQRFVDPLTIDAVLISHLHADHFFDLSGYYVLRKYHPAGPHPRIPVRGPQGTQARLAVAYGLPEDPGMTEEFDFACLAEPAEIGPFQVSACRVVHPIEAYAIKVSAAGRTLVYSGDSAPCSELTEFARGADLLLAEAAFRDGEDNPPDVHMTGSDAARTAAEAGAARLVLTHIAPWHDPRVALAEADGIFAGETTLATVGAGYEI